MMGNRIQILLNLLEFGLSDETSREYLFGVQHCTIETLDSQILELNIEILDPQTLKPKSKVLFHNL